MFSNKLFMSCARYAVHLFLATAHDMTFVNVLHTFATLIRVGIHLGLFPKRFPGLVQLDGIRFTLKKYSHEVIHRDFYWG